MCINICILCDGLCVSKYLIILLKQTCLQNQSPNVCECKQERTPDNISLSTIFATHRTAHFSCMQAIIKDIWS